MFFRKVIYLVCYSSIFSPFLFLLPCCFSLSLCSLAYLFVFCLLLLFVFLAFSLSLCRCPFLFLGFQLFAVFFCPSPGFFPGFCAFFAPFPLFFRPFSFHKPLKTNTFARTPSEPSPTTSKPAPYLPNKTSSSLTMYYKPINQLLFVFSTINLI